MPVDFFSISIICASVRNLSQQSEAHFSYQELALGACGQKFRSERCPERNVPLNQEAQEPEKEKVRL